MLFTLPKYFWVIHNILQYFKIKLSQRQGLFTSHSFSSLILYNFYFINLFLLLCPIYAFGRPKKVQKYFKFYNLMAVQKSFLVVKISQRIRKIVNWKAWAFSFQKAWAPENMMICCLYHYQIDLYLMGQGLTLILIIMLSCWITFLSRDSLIFNITK